MRNIRAGLLLTSLLLSTASWGADVETLTANCEACHGPAGVSAHADVPTIAGQTATYLLKTLRAYQRWDRPCIKSDYRNGDSSKSRTDMCQVAEGLSNEDMEALSQHYSALPFIPAQQAFDSELAAAGAILQEGTCAKCHADGGKVAGTGPRLAGQWMDYLRTSLKYVPTGEHLVPRTMENAVTGLSREDLDKLLHYYASQQD